jgi:hypothetical protein
MPKPKLATASRPCSTRPEPGANGSPPFMAWRISKNTRNAANRIPSASATRTGVSSRRLRITHPAVTKLSAGMP